MKPRLAALASAVMILAVPGAASAATLTVRPAKPCFGTGDRVNFFGTGYTPGAIVDFTRDGERVRADPPITADATGSVEAGLTVLKRGGPRIRTYAATDRSNPANTASTRVRVSEAMVRVRPLTGRPTRIRRIAAVGFTTGRTLWAHLVRRGRVLRNFRIGALRGPCHDLTTRRRLFRSSPSFGRYLIQFDTSRRYRRSLTQRDRYNFTVFGSEG
jgi:hypothetical protein